MIHQKDMDKGQCKLWGHKFSGVVHRIKQQIVSSKGNVKSSSVAKDEDRINCCTTIEKAKNNKKEKIYLKKLEMGFKSHLMRSKVDEIADIGSKRLRDLTPIENYASKIDADSSIPTSRKMRQRNVHNTLFKQLTNQVHQFLARWVYKDGISLSTMFW